MHNPQAPAPPSDIEQGKKKDPDHASYIYEVGQTIALPLASSPNMNNAFTNQTFCCCNSVRTASIFWFSISLILELVSLISSCLQEDALCVAGIIVSDYWNKSVQLLKRNENDSLSGNYVALNGPPLKFLRYFLGLQKPNEKLILATVENTSKDLEQIVEMLNATGFRPRTHRFMFDPIGIENGFELLKSRRTKGKIVFDISC